MGCGPCRAQQCPHTAGTVILPCARVLLPAQGWELGQTSSKWPRGTAELCPSPVIGETNHSGFRGCLRNFIFRGASELCMREGGISEETVAWGCISPFLTQALGIQAGNCRGWKEMFAASTPSRPMPAPRTSSASSTRELGGQL